MTEIKFYENIADELLKFAVIVSKAQNKYVFCKHRNRDQDGGAEFPAEAEIRFCIVQRYGSHHCEYQHGHIEPACVVVGVHSLEKAV